MSCLPPEVERAMMADLYEHAAKLCRQGDAYRAYTVSRWAMRINDRSQWAEDSYRTGLHFCGLSQLDIDAAVVAIYERRHPPDSLPAFVEKMAHECSLEDPGYRIDWVATLERIGAKR